MISAYYKNSKGEILDLLTWPYQTAQADWYDSEWDESVSGEYQRTVQVDVFGKDSDDFAQNMERLYSIIAVDSEEGLYGRLYVNDTFLRCRIQASRKTNWQGYVLAEVDLTFIAPVLAWTTELKKEFQPQSSAMAVDGLDFPFDFPFDFADERNGTAVWEVDHVTSSDFQMIVYGPCVNPRILINGWPYEVFTTLETREYLVIDSRDCTVLKYLSNGTAQNLFHDRGLEYSVFEKIPPGLLRFNWPGTFGYDLTLFPERREARW